jgi:HSP20 family protein
MEMLDPFDELARMHEEIDRLFSRFFRTSKPLLGFGREGRELAKYESFRAPLADIRETENFVIATFELPGADKNDIELNVDENRIEVKVEKKAEKEVKKKGAYSYEARSHQYYRALPLPAEVESEKIEAVYKDGILKVEIPKVKKVKEKKKRIEIK